MRDDKGISLNFSENEIVVLHNLSLIKYRVSEHLLDLHVGRSGEFQLSKWAAVQLL